MKLTAKILLSVLLGNLVGLVFLYQFHFYLMAKLEGVVQLEAAVQTNQSFQAGIELLKNGLQSKIVDWANWDDAYQAVQSPEKQVGFFKSNFQTESMVNAGVQHLAIWGGDRQMIYGQHLVKNGQINSESIDKEITQYVEKWFAADFPQSRVVLIKTRSGIALIQICAVRNVKGDSKPLGAILMGYDFNVKNLEFLSSTLGRKISFQEAPYLLGSENILYKAIWKDQRSILSVQKTLFNNDGQKIGYFVASDDLRGQEYITLIKKYFWWGAFFVMALSTGLIVASIFQFVIKPLKSVRKQIYKLYDGDQKSTIEVSSADEINELIKQLNISKREHLEDQEHLKKIQDRLVLSNSRLATTEVSQSLAKELNMPLATAKVTAEVLVQKFRRSKDFDVDMLSEILKLDLLVKKISKSVEYMISEDGGVAEAARLDVEVDEIVYELEQITIERLSRKNIKLVRRRIDRGAVRAPKKMLIQSLLGLIWNSEEAISDDGVGDLGGDKEKWIQFDVRAMGQFVHFRVTDSGSGISEELQRQMMEPFFSTKEHGSHSGLGLAEIRKFARQLGGDLFYELEMGHTSFVLVLPLQNKMDVSRAAL